jgi:hypothetical protein
MLGICTAFLLASCETVQVASDYDRSANFTNYHTFTILRREHKGIPNPLVAVHAEEDIKQELQRRGYTLVADPASADFTIDFSVGAKDRIDINSYPAMYAGPFFGGWGNNIDVRQYQEGTLSVNIFDGRTHRPVWHGWAKKALSRKDIEQPAEPVSKAVDSVLARFPPPAT